MEQKGLIKFENVELELLSSESELSEVRGGRGVVGLLKEILMGGDIEVNNNCNCECSKK